MSAPQEDDFVATTAVAASASAQPAPRREMSLEWMRRLIVAAYPELDEVGVFVETSLPMPRHWDGQFISAAFGVPDGSDRNRPRPRTQQEIWQAYRLQAFFRGELDFSFSLVLFSGGLARSLELNRAQKAASKLPERTAETVSVLLAEHGARFGPGERARLVQSFRPERFSDTLGPLRILSTEFEISNPYDLSEDRPTTLRWQLVAETTANPSVKYLFELEPFDGRVVLIGIAPEDN